MKYVVIIFVGYNLNWYHFLQVVTITENVKFSQSALSAAACFKRVSVYIALAYMSTTVLLHI